jgi:hypothetical protein
MQVDLLEGEAGIKKVIFLLKWPIAFSFCLLFALAFLMSKIHPKRVSYEKEYNYLYSIIDDLKNGRVRNVDIIKDKVSFFSSLHPEVDSDLIKYSLKEGNYLDAESILEGVHKRAGFENTDIKSFSLVSLDLERKNIDRAYQQALSIKENSALKKQSPSLYAYNLYRIYILEKMQDNEQKAVLTAKDLKSFINSIEGTKDFNSPLIEQIYKKMNNEPLKESHEYNQ